MKNIESKVKDILAQDIELPSEYQYMIRNTLEEYSAESRATLYTKVLRAITAACACAIVLTSIVYAKDISNFIHHFFNNNRGMDLAINEGYIDDTNTNYATSQNVLATDMEKVIDAQNTEIKVENMLMDDYNLSFTFSVNLDENINIDKVASIDFPDILITDENNNILVCTQKYLFDDYCKENNLDYTYGEFNEHNINSGGELHSIESLNGTHTSKIVYNFNACIYPYPKSKKLYIKIARVDMSKEITFTNSDIVLKGNWNLDIDVSEKFYNRESIIYKVKSCSDDQIQVTEACVYNTGMVLKFTSQDEPIWEDSDSREVIVEKSNKFKKYMSYLNENNLKFINSEYIKNEQGEVFTPVESGLDGGEGTIYAYDGKFTHWRTFDLINSKASSNLTVYIDLFLQKTRRTVVIELEKK